MLLDSHSFACPWCGEINEIAIDPDEAGQVLIQDCAICCAPIEVVIPLSSDGLVEARREGQ